MFIAVTTATMTKFSHRTLSMHSDHIINNVVTVPLYSSKSFTSVATATEDRDKVQCNLLWGPSCKDHTRLPQGMIMVLIPHCLLCSSLSEVEEDIKNS